MKHRIRIVKREVRILGLDFCNKKRVAGAILRGGDFLDGVMVIERDENLDDDQIAHRILSMRHYPELRAIMIHDPSGVSNPETIERVSRLPVITVSEENTRKREFRPYQVRRGTVWARTSLSNDTVTKVMTLAWTQGRLPEAARVAHLLAQARMPKPPFKP